VVEHFKRTPFETIAERAATLPRDFLALMADERHLERAASHAATLSDLNLKRRSDTIGALVCYAIDTKRERFTIGRRTNNDIVILDQRVSGSHVALEIGYARTYWLSDLGSSNGTSFQGRDLKRGPAGRVMIKVGDVFLLAGFPLTLVDREHLVTLATGAAERR
jgi:hypothetical protein